MIFSFPIENFIKEAHYNFSSTLFFFPYGSGDETQGVFLCVHGCVSMWRPEVETRCLPQYFIIIGFETEFLTELGAHGWVTPVSLLTPPSCARVADMCHHAWLIFFYGYWVYKSLCLHRKSFTDLVMFSDPQLLLYTLRMPESYY